MSGIAGIFNFDGAGIDPALLDRMTDAIPYRGPDGSGKWIGGSVGLGHQRLCATPESLNERQPMSDDTGNLCLTFDGRVDNREELKASLAAKGMRLRDDTDAELVLKGYACWGEKIAEKILGDFAFALWNESRRLLFCARDILGLKPFYYFCDGRRFMFGSELQQILKDPEVPRKPNEAMVAEYLMSAVNSKEETLYQGVFRLPPAHFMTVQDGRVRKHRYWDLDPKKEIRYGSDQEYADHLLEIFREAVACRLRSNGKVAVQLSGGVDSSAVAGVAKSLVNKMNGSRPDLETFSVVFPGWGCDESRYIDAVNRMWNIEGHALPPRVPDRKWHEAQVDRYLDIPDYPNGSMTDSIETLAREKGYAVMLTGLGGDEWFTGSDYHYFDLLRNFKISSLIRRVRHDYGRHAIIPYPPKSLLDSSLRPLIPKKLLRRIGNLKNGTHVVPEWIGSTFSRSIDLTGRLRKEVNWRGFSSAAQGAQYTASTAGFQTHAIEMEERSAAYFGIELRHPFHDRRILEFGMAIPEEQRCNGHYDKSVLRKAMRSCLPEAVLQRRSKAEFSQVFKHALQIQGGRDLFERLSIGGMGWVNAKVLGEQYEKLLAESKKANDEMTVDVWPFWHTFGIELWFNRVFNGKPALPEGSAVSKKTADG